MTTARPQLPPRLIADLTSCMLDPSVVEGVACEATARSPWIVSLDRSKIPNKGTYATIRTNRSAFFDTFDEALQDAGGHLSPPATGSYFEMVPAMSGPELQLSFPAPITFVGQIADIIFLSVPIGLINQDQMRSLRDAIRLTLSEATRAGKIPSTDLRTVLLPDGVKLFRFEERRHE